MIGSSFDFNISFSPPPIRLLYLLILNIILFLRLIFSLLEFRRSKHVFLAVRIGAISLSIYDVHVRRVYTEDDYVINSIIWCSCTAWMMRHLFRISQKYEWKYWCLLMTGAFSVALVQRAVISMPMVLIISHSFQAIQ